jgi:hypothetical protein
MHLIQRLLEVIGMDPKTVNSRSIPAIKPLLFKDVDRLIRKYNWNYRQAIGMLNRSNSTTAHSTIVRSRSVVYS